VGYNTFIDKKNSAIICVPKKVFILKNKGDIFENNEIKLLYKKAFI